MKICGRCREEKQLDQFAKRTKAKDGLQPWCKSCSNKVRMECYRNQPTGSRRYSTMRVNEWLRRMREYLSNHPCVDCGESDWFVLEFDHVRGTKIEYVTTLVRKGVAWKRVEEEIEKCDVRCSNCHRRRHHRERYKEN